MGSILAMGLLIIGLTTMIPVAFWMGIQIGIEREKDAHN